MCAQKLAPLQADNHASTPPLSFFTGRMPFLPPNQQHQSTEGIFIIYHTELNDKKWGKRKECKVKTDRLRSIGKQSWAISVQYW